MPFTPLISVTELQKHLSDPDWVVVDCRFELGDAEARRRKWGA